MSNFKSIGEAKAFLKENGYFTDNLWSVSDVQSKFKCTDEQAQKVLDRALNNSGTMEQIWFAIGLQGKEDGLKEVFELFDSVETPEPDETDAYNHSFVGTIVAFKGGYAVVEDGDGDCWDIEVERLTISVD